MEQKEMELAADAKAKETIRPYFYSSIARVLSTDYSKIKKVLRDVTLAARHVLLLDWYYENNEAAYKEIAQKSWEELLFGLNEEQQASLQKLYDSLSSFWEYEKSLLSQKKFILAQRRQYIRKKSSDVLLYCFIAGTSVPFPKEVVHFLHSRQQLNDIYDDLLDVDEDRKNKSPNLVFLFSWDYRSPTELRENERREILTLADQLFEDVWLNAGKFPFIINDAEATLKKIKRTLSN